MHLSKGYRIFNTILYGVKVACAINIFLLAVELTSDGNWKSGIIFALCAFLAFYLIKKERESDRRLEKNE